MNHNAIFLAALVLGSPGLSFGASQAGQTSVEQWAFLPWDTAVGRVQGKQADSFGPASFAVMPDGGVLLLDQVNRRVMKLGPDGDHLGDLPLPEGTFDDLEQVDGRAVLLLDRLARRQLLVQDLSGAPIARVDLEGRGIAHSGLVTALLPRPDGVWLEVRHRYSVKVLNQGLEPCERQIVLGRPIANGRSLHGAKDGAGGVRIWIARRNDRSTPSPVTLTGADPIRRIVWLDQTSDGHLAVALHEIAYATVTPYPKLRERMSLVVLDGQLTEVARLASDWGPTLLYQPVEVRIGPDGRFWQMAFDERGVHLLRWDWRTP